MCVVGKECMSVCGGRERVHECVWGRERVYKCVCGGGRGVGV